MRPRKDFKRVDLLVAADLHFRLLGFHKTTLAMIAQESGVELGNIHYYFKTKEEMLNKLQDSHLNMMRSFDSLTNYIQGTMQDIVTKGFVGITLPDEQYKLKFFKELEVKFKVPINVLIKLYGIFTLANIIEKSEDRELFILDRLNEDLGIDFNN